MLMETFQFGGQTQEYVYAANDNYKWMRSGMKKHILYIGESRGMATFFKETVWPTLNLYVQQ